MIKKETKLDDISSIKRFRILIVGSKKSGKDVLVQRIIQSEKVNNKLKINSEVQFGLFEKYGEKFIVEFYDNFHYELGAYNRIKFLEQCNLAIVVGNSSETDIGESINIIEDFEYDLGKLFPWFIPFRTIIVRTKVNINDNLTDEYLEEPCFKNSSFLDLSRDKREINNELLLLKDDILTQITNPLDYHLMEKITTNLKSDDNKDQQLAINMIGKYHLKQFANEIAKLAFSIENVMVKCAAIWALGELGLTNYTDKLIELFQMHNSIDNEVKAEIMIALLKMLDPSKKEILEDIIAKNSILTRINQLPFELLLYEREVLML
ncbi:MAG: HEAT repeat domain-containing protein [Asgard group archaeon]|nr:HEAT repeat domain-containing protein [Asgard group archaeon]